jgi:hypothetical protein
VWTALGGIFAGAAKFSHIENHYMKLIFNSFSPKKTFQKTQFLDKRKWTKTHLQQCRIPPKIPMTLNASVIAIDPVIGDNVRTSVRYFNLIILHLLIYWTIQTEVSGSGLFIAHTHILLHVYESIVN